MTEWKARRFWKTVSVSPAEGGYRVTLDDKPLMTPGKHPLILPTQALARAVAEEWEAQRDIIQPTQMPLTRAANSAIEKVAPQREAVADMLASYGESDLLCYRAKAPADLLAEQQAAWDPLLDWAKETLGAPLKVTRGVMPVAQDAAVVAKLRAILDDLDLFALTALHDLVTIPGSLILGLAVLKGRLDAGQAHDLASIDEEFQARIWGRDEEADQAAANRREAMDNAARLLALSRNA